MSDESLGNAVDAGFADFELMRTDSDLDAIRGPEFDAILAAAETRD
ncbi:MAG: hypothetical protein OEV00_03615 [Acidobacteriota bacterium]|nr:hypothetical protein [Acidobacteriota bacterium]MDH3784398.1 hypothetical protein [Acidobacteriota bacterium]